MPNLSTPRRVVVTGMGMLTPLGLNREASFARALSGAGAVAPAPESIRQWLPRALAAFDIRRQLRGPTNTYSVACASSAMAIGEAFRNIRHGYSDAIVAVGCEAMINPGSFIAWNALRVLARPVSGDVAASCRPFDRDRSGFVLGEGAAALVLEEADAAQRRGARIYAELCGYGSTSDASHITLPSREGQVTCMRMALDEAQTAPAEVGYLNAHGTATETGDVVEAEAIQAVFGDGAPSLPVSSTKSLHGHMIGAGGAVELAFTLLALHSGSIPPTAYLDNPDPRCGLDHVARTARHGRRMVAAMSNSFAFGGTNVSLVVRAWEG